MNPKLPQDLALAGAEGRLEWAAGYQAGLLKMHSVGLLASSPREERGLTISLFHFAGWPYPVSDAPPSRSPPPFLSKRALYPFYILLLLHISHLVAGTCSPRVSSNTCSELPLQHRPLSWGSTLQETARDLRGVNEPADIKLRSQVVLTPRCPVPVLTRRSRCFQNNTALRTPLPCLSAPITSSVVRKNVSLHSQLFSSRAEATASAESSRRAY